MPPRQSMMYVTIHDWILERKKWYFYLIPPDPFGKLDEIITAPVNEAFFKVAAGYMNAFLKKGEMPPAQIAPVIFNMLDDYSAGREVVIRTGDYIAIQSFLRETKQSAH